MFILGKKIGFSKNDTLIISIIFLLFALIIALRLPWNETIDDVLIDIQFKLRGARQVSDEIVLVFIGDEDVKALNGWPITRDYYSFLIHILNTLEARVIGIDILLSRSDNSHPEYDRILADFIYSYGNICLPFTFSELSHPEGKTLSDSINLLQGRNSTFPLKKFKKYSAGIGFSNFERASMPRRVPLAVTTGDSIVYSFGVHLAQLYLGRQRPLIVNPVGISLADADGSKHTIPTDCYGRMRLNHFGDLENIMSISLLDLLQTFEKEPDALDFKDKLVIVAVTASGLANLKPTPLSTALPASLIHATIAENCIKENYLREISLLGQWLLLLLSVLSAASIWYIKIQIRRFIVSTGLILIYGLFTLLIFSAANLVIPLFYPVIAFLSTLAYLGLVQRQKRVLLESSLKALLDEQIKAKEKILEETRVKLNEMGEQLKREVKLSDQSKQLAEERKETIFRLENEINDLKAYTVYDTRPSKVEFSEIIYNQNSKIRPVLELIAKIRTDDIPVLIMGETGTGKEMIARAIHRTSQRNEAPFISVNCGALSETLLESELFGHEKGSFTGAHSRRRGRFEMANGGTIFLDEITETTPAFQARLLRVLQEKSFERVGGEETIQTNVRIIAATNKDINREMENNLFRADLFYRLNGFPINLPSLKERTEDIPLLTLHFLKKHDFESITGFSDQAIQMLQGYVWPGNVRELENVIRRAAILAQSENRQLIRETDLPEELRVTKSLLSIETVHKPFEQQILETMQSLRFSHTSISQTARILGNKDRGTVTEYFRGICFEQLVKADFDVDKAVTNIAGTREESVTEKVKAKVGDYLNNLRSSTENLQIFEHEGDKLPAAYRGLPKKYHTYLNQVLEHLAQK